VGGDDEEPSCRPARDSVGLVVADDLFLVYSSNVPRKATAAVVAIAMATVVSSILFVMLVSISRFGLKNVAGRDAWIHSCFKMN
jgi:hypothetical protein